MRDRDVSGPTGMTAEDRNVLATVCEKFDVVLLVLFGSTAE